jgi:hypothetical protein
MSCARSPATHAKPSSHAFGGTAFSAVFAVSLSAAFCALLDTLSVTPAVVVTIGRTKCSGPGAPPSARRSRGLRDCVRFKPVQELVESLHVSIVLFPSLHIPDVSHTPEVCGPGDPSLLHRVVDLNGEQYELMSFALLLEGRLSFFLNPLAANGMLREDQEHFVMDADGLIDSRPVSAPHGRSWGANQQRTPLFCRSACRRSANAWSRLE